MADATPNHGNPKYLVSLAGLTDEEADAALERFAAVLAGDDDRGPVTCPACGSTEVRGENGMPPIYTCACGHRWRAPVNVLE